MALKKLLREWVKQKDLRKTARALGIDQTNLYRSLQDVSTLKLGKVEELLNYIGYDLKRKGKGGETHKIKAIRSRWRKEEQYDGKQPISSLLVL